MNLEHGTRDALGLARWAVVAVLIVAGVALFFLFGGERRPVVAPSAAEAP